MSENKTPKARRAPIDWEAVERDYRIGQLTVRQIQAKHNVSNGAMMERSKREGWERDLTEAVKIATKAKVRAKVVEQVKEQASNTGTTTGATTGASSDATGAKPEQVLAQATEQATRDDIEIAATVNTNIILGHQRRAGRLANLLDKMAGELEVVSENPLELEQIVIAIGENDPSAAQAIAQLRSVSSRMNTLKLASDILVKVNAEERKAFGLDDEGNNKDSIDEEVKRINAEEGWTQ